MPSIPQQVTLTSTSVEVLNAIRNQASINYQNYIPIATNSAESIREIGAVIMDYPSLQNEFLQGLVGRIGKVLITSKTYENPWAMFKKGFLEFGETIEEIFVNIAQPFQYDVEVAESELYKRVIPDVKATFHILNYKKFYKQTVQQDSLRTAFLSWSGVTNLISKIIESMYTASNYDELLTMKYMLAKKALNGQMFTVAVPQATAENMKEIVTTIKSVSNSFEFLSDKYNLARVMNNSYKNEQYVIVTTDFDAKMDVEVLASAFNMDKVQFMGQRVLIDSFGELDTKRLAELFKDDVNYVPFTPDEILALKQIPCILVDKDFFMIFDNLQQVGEVQNIQGLYWNHILHVWKTFSTSPYANNALFVNGIPTVNSVVVTPSTLTLAKGQTAQLGVIVDTENFASKSVNWTMTGNVSDKSIVTPSGFVYIDKEETASSITVTAKSIVSEIATGTCTITIAV